MSAEAQPLVTEDEKVAIVAHFNRVTGVTTPLEVDIIEQAVAHGFTTWVALREEMRQDVEAGR